MLNIYNKDIDERLESLPCCDEVEVEQLRQLARATWDGNLIGKSTRDRLVSKGLVERFNGWNVVTKLGLCMLDTLGELKK